MFKKTTLLSGYLKDKRALIMVFLIFSMFGPIMDARASFSSILVDAESGRVLHEERADALNYPASLTKMMTLYLVFSALEENRISLDTRWFVSHNASRQPPTKLGLKAGRSITVQDCILALVTKSANDMAVVVAEGMAGSEFRFADMMTQKSRDLNMWQTTFRNASGLPDSGQMTSARDMAKLAMALYRDFPTYYRFFSTREFHYGTRVFRNHNRLLEAYPGTDGIKTGFIRASGYNLAASAVRNGKRLIGVVLGGHSSNDRNQQMMSLLDRGFAMVNGPYNLYDSGFVRLDSGSDFERRVSRFEPERLVYGTRLASWEPPKPPETERGYTRPETRLVKRGLQVSRLGEPVDWSRYGIKRYDGDSLRTFSAAPERESRSVERLKQKSTEKVAKSSRRSKRSEKTEGDGWAIQVGAFTSLKPARSAASRAKESAAKALRHARTDISSVRGKKGKYYRARLVGMDKRDALKACKILLAKRFSCMTVPPSKGLTEVTSR